MCPLTSHLQKSPKAQNALGTKCTPVSSMTRNHKIYIFDGVSAEKNHNLIIFYKALKEHLKSYSSENINNYRCCVEKYKMYKLCRQIHTLKVTQSVSKSHILLASLMCPVAPGTCVESYPNMDTSMILLNCRDSYWIIKGLLLSGMTDTVKGMLSNFVSMVDQ